VGSIGAVCKKVYKRRGIGEQSVLEFEREGSEVLLRKRNSDRNLLV